MNSIWYTLNLFKGPEWGMAFPRLYPCTHKRQVGYIKTDKCVSKERIKKGGNINPFVLAHCSRSIIQYNEILNTLNLEGMTVAEKEDPHRYGEEGLVNWKMLF